MDLGLRVATWFSKFSSNCFRKIEARAMVTAMTMPIDSARTTRRGTPPGSSAHIHHRHYFLKETESGTKEKMAWGVGATY